MTLKTFQTIENNISKLMEGEACNIQLINEICLDYKWFVTDSSISLFTFHLFNVFKRNLLQHLPTLPRRSMCGVSQKSANKKKASFSFEVCATLQRVSVSAPVKLAGRPLTALLSSITPFRGSHLC